MRFEIIDEPSQERFIPTAEAEELAAVAETTSINITIPMGMVSALPPAEQFLMWEIRRLRQQVQEGFIQVGVRNERINYWRARAKSSEGQLKAHDTDALLRENGEMRRQLADRRATVSAAGFRSGLTDLVRQLTHDDIKARNDIGACIQTGRPVCDRDGTDEGCFRCMDTSAADDAWTAHVRGRPRYGRGPA